MLLGNCLTNLSKLKFKNYERGKNFRSSDVMKEITRSQLKEEVLTHFPRLQIRLQFPRLFFQLTSFRPFYLGRAQGSLYTTKILRGKKVYDPFNSVVHEVDEAKKAWSFVYAILVPGDKIVTDIKPSQLNIYRLSN